MIFANETAAWVTLAGENTPAMLADVIGGTDKKAIRAYLIEHKGFDEASKKDTDWAVNFIAERLADA